MRRAPTPRAGTESRPVVIHWVDENMRSAGLAKALDADLVVMPWAAPLQGGSGKLASWWRSARATVRTLRRVPAGTLVVVVAPPVFAPLVAMAVARRRRLPIAVDLHSGALLDPRWRWSVPLMEALLRAADAVIVTNREILEGVRLAGTEVVVVVDPWVALTAADDAPSWEPASPPYVLCPASGNPDEPLDAVAGAADRLPEGVGVVVTGRVQDRFGTPRVTTPGFVPRAEFDALLSGASAVLALTLRPATTQRSAFEALQRGTPVVCSDTQVLRDVCGDAAVFVDNTAEGIERGITEALRRGQDLSARAQAQVKSLRADVDDGVARVGALAGPPERPGSPSWGLGGPVRNRPVVRALLWSSKGKPSRIRSLRRLLGLVVGSDFRSSHFGAGLYLPHPFGIVVHASARIGDRCVIYQHVTIGEDNSRPGVPVIGDDVVIGAGAAVLGPVVVGDGARIGANAVVVADVAPGAVVVGVPARPVGGGAAGPADGRG